MTIFFFDHWAEMAYNHKSKETNQITEQLKSQGNKQLRQFQDHPFPNTHFYFSFQPGTSSANGINAPRLYQTSTPQLVRYKSGFLPIHPFRPLIF